MQLDAASESRLAALKGASLNRWIALSADETHVVAEGDSFEEVATMAERNGEPDPLIIRTPESWMPRTL